MKRNGRTVVVLAVTIGALSIGWVARGQQLELKRDARLAIAGDMGIGTTNLQAQLDVLGALQNPSSTIHLPPATLQIRQVKAQQTGSLLSRASSLGSTRQRLDD